MSKQPDATTKISFFQKALIFFAGMITPIFVVYTLTKSPPPAPEADAKVVERIKPLAAVEISGNSGPHIDKSGEEVVKSACAACHTAGMMGSPKIGDKTAWGPRITQGFATLTKHAIEGIRAMPPRGGNPDLSDNEIAAAVAHMANQSGAKFVAPKQAEAAPAK